MVLAQQSNTQNNKYRFHLELDLDVYGNANDSTRNGRNFEAEQVTLQMEHLGLGTATPTTLDIFAAYDEIVTIDPNGVLETSF